MAGSKKTLIVEFAIDNDTEIEASIGLVKFWTGGISNLIYKDSRVEDGKYLIVSGDDDSVDDDSVDDSPHCCSYKCERCDEKDDIKEMKHDKVSGLIVCSKCIESCNCRQNINLGKCDCERH